MTLPTSASSAAPRPTAARRHRGLLLPTALCAALLLGGCSAMIAQNPSSTLQPVNAVADAGDERVMLAGHDVVAYFTQGRHAPGLLRIKSVYQGVTFRFATEQHKALFDANPVKYLPQYGGYCAFGLARGYKAVIDPAAFTIACGKLYLNYNASIQSQWLRQRDSDISRADALWPKVKHNPEVAR